LLCGFATCARAGASFEAFDRRASAGETLTVVFFGASLTWGANATDPMTTSYRARAAERFETAYPQARFRFFDAAIGGTGSQLGVFRLDRDVLRRKPDLVFLDFSANDDIMSTTPETLASYEAIARRLVAEAGVPVVPVMFPFQWNVTGGTTAGMVRRDAHLAIAKAYHAPCGDAISLIIERIKAGKTTAEALWDTDGVHPGDEGYKLFAEAAWTAYMDGVNRLNACRAPDKMLYADTYMHQSRVRLTTLFGAGHLPAGWQAGKPQRTSSCLDMQMSRWLDDLLVARGASAAPLQLRFHGSMVMLFGESTTKSGFFRAIIDGKTMERVEGGKTTDLFNAGGLGQMMGNTAHLSPVIAAGLDPATGHTLELVPRLAPDQELRIESICVAGGQATVERYADAPADATK
jgi:lysophospholipase L1-like esterase